MVETDTSVCCQVVNEPMRKMSWPACTHCANQRHMQWWQLILCVQNTQFNLTTKQMTESLWKTLSWPFCKVSYSSTSPVRYSMICLKKNMSVEQMLVTNGDLHLNPEGHILVYTTLLNRCQAGTDVRRWSYTCC